MNRQNINLITATVSIVLAIQAFIIVLLMITTSWDRGLSDEGPAAHIFQILIVAEVLFTLGFLATSDWKRIRQVIQVIGFQVAIFVATFATGHFFKL
jgi:hypothetical protein